MNIKELIKGKKLLAVDFGLKRVGLALSDEFHITIKPIDTLAYNSEDFLLHFTNIIEKENIEIIIIGVPVREDSKNDKFINEIDKFINTVKNKKNIEFIKYDEFMSSKKAVAAMIEIGKKKKQRREKGNLDKIAAAVILRDFLNDYEGGF